MAAANRLQSRADNQRFVDWFLDFTYRYRRWCFLAVLGLYLAGFNGQWRIEPDAALYLTLGRNLAEGRGYTYLWKPHHLAYPGLPWMIAGTLKLFGTAHFWPAHVLMLLIAFATLALVYRLFLLHSGPQMAVLITLGVAITKTFYRYAFEMRSDMPFLLGVMAFLVGYEATFAEHHPVRSSGKVQSWLLMFAGLALATTMRPTIWVLLLAILCTFAYTAVRGRTRWRAVVLFMGVIVAVALAFRAFDPRRSSSASDDYEAVAIRSVTTGLGSTLTNAVHNNLHDLLYLATPDALMQVRLGPANVLISLVFIAIGIGLMREHILWGVFVGLIVVMNFIVLPLDRYFLPVVPLMAYAWWLLLVRLNRTFPRRLGNLAAFGLLALGLCSNFDKVGGIILEQRWVPFLACYQGGIYQPLAKLAKEINEKVDDNSLVLIRHANGRIVNFLSHRNVVDLRHFNDVDLHAHPVYVVEPTDWQTEDLLKENSLLVGEPIASVKNKSGLPVWTLHRAVPISAH
jgi:4-amino-4-deoxy-L-arabinose transferase-like glycosyltransferase